MVPLETHAPGHKRCRQGLKTHANNNKTQARTYKVHKKLLKTNQIAAQAMRKNRAEHMDPRSWKAQR